MYYSPDNIGENETQNIEIYPNHAKDMLTVKAENLSSVAIYNSIGQKVFEQNHDANEMTINTNDFESGIYMVRIVAYGHEMIRKVSVMK